MSGQCTVMMLRRTRGRHNATVPGQVIQGWDQGVQGMKVGGRRKLVIPPEMGYGNRGAGNVIKPGETLIFICDLVSA